MENKSQLKRLDRFCMFLSRHPLAILLSLLIIAGIFFYGALTIRGEVILQQLLPYDHPYLKLHARFAEVFGSGGSGVVIAVKAKEGDVFKAPTLEKIKKMTEEIELWDEVYRVLTVSMASRSVKVVKTLKKGMISIRPLMWPDVPTNPQEMATLKADIFSNPAYVGTLGFRGWVCGSHLDRISGKHFLSKGLYPVAQIGP